MGAHGAVLDGASRFAHVLFGGAAITFTAGMLDSVLRGEGNVRVPAIWSSASLLGQIAITPVLMFGMGLGLVGAPIAMLACQAIALLPRLRWVFGAVQRQAGAGPAPGPAPTLAILSVGVPAAVATSLANLGIMVLTGVFTRLGPDALAAYGLATRLDFVLLSLAYGVGVRRPHAGGNGGRRPPSRSRARGGGAGRRDDRRAARRAGGPAGVAAGAVARPLHCRSRGARRRRRLLPHRGTDLPVGRHQHGGVVRVPGSRPRRIPTAFMAARIALLLAAALFVTGRLGLGPNAVFGVIAACNVAAVAAMLLLYRWLRSRMLRGAPSDRR